MSASNSITGLNSSYTYDADGLRLTKTVNGVEHKYVWQGGRLVSEYYDGKELEFFYDESGAPYALSCKSGASAAPVMYYYVTNLQGDVVRLLDSSGSIKASYAYSAWGKLIDVSGDMAGINPLRYRGYYYDADTDLYYLKSRYYDPQICRFINADGATSTGQGIRGCNMFAYCGNNPISRVDSGGNEWKNLFFAGFAVAAIGLAIIAAVPTGGSSLALAGVGISAATATAAGNTLTLAGASVMLASVAEGVSSSTPTSSSRNSKGLYSVYFLEDRSGRIQYVGRVLTANLSSRMAYHQNTRGLFPAKVISGLTRFEARGLEEIGMIECHTINRSNPLNNQIHGVGINNKNGSVYMNAALNYLSNRAEDEFLNFIGW